MVSFLAAGVLEAPQGECGHVRRCTAANCAIDGAKCENFFLQSPVVATCHPFSVGYYDSKDKIYMLTSHSPHDVIIISLACLHLVCHFDALLLANTDLHRVANTSTSK